MDDTLARLAADNDLKDWDSRSPDGLTERYLYSSDMVFRYAFGRWWGDTGLATTAVWVLLNPATGDTNNATDPRWKGASRGRGPPDTPGWSS